MNSNWRSNLTKSLTAVYMIAAGMVTIATSKSPSGSGTANYLTAAGYANYSVESNCQSTASQNVDAVSTFSGSIVGSLDSDGRVRTSTVTDFTQFGFPTATMIMGVDAYSATNAQKCTVRQKTTRAYPVGLTQDSGYTFITPGQLTTVLYDCYDSTTYRCSIWVSELPSGDLQRAYNNY